MKTFEILVKETLETVVSIEAKDECEAKDKVREMYRNEEIVLGADEHTATEFLLWDSEAENVACNV